MEASSSSASNDITERNDNEDWTLSVNDFLVDEKKIDEIYPKAFIWSQKNMNLKNTEQPKKVSIRGGRLCESIDKGGETETLFYSFFEEENYPTKMTKDNKPYLNFPKFWNYSKSEEFNMKKLRLLLFCFRKHNIQTQHWIYLNQKNTLLVKLTESKKKLSSELQGRCINPIKLIKKEQKKPNSNIFYFRAKEEWDIKEEIDIPGQIVGLFIGHEGKNIKKLQNVTKTKIEVKKNGILHISGKPKNVEEAKKLVNKFKAEHLDPKL